MAKRKSTCVGQLDLFHSFDEPIGVVLSPNEQRKLDQIIAQAASMAATRRAARAIVRKKRRTAVSRQTPPWANLATIAELQRQARVLSAITGVIHHVDHVIPLQGKLVSGLHVETNMAIIPMDLNAKKGARFAPGDVPPVESRLGWRLK